MTGFLRPLIAGVFVLCLGAGSALAQGRSGKAEPPGKGYGVRSQIEKAMGQPADVDDASEQLETSERERKEKSSAAREKLTKEERAELKAEEGPGFWGRMRRFFGWERSQERMSEQGREHQRASEQERGPKER